MSPQTIQLININVKTLMKVVAVEMVQDIAENYLTVNVRLNGYVANTVNTLESIGMLHMNREIGPFFTVLGNMAVSHVDGEETHFKQKLHNVGGARIELKSTSSSAVMSLTVDSILKIHKIDSVAFCKIDTESHEAAVLKGAQESLQKKKIRELVTNTH